MNNRDKAVSAVLSAFPSPETWVEFSQNSANSLISESVINFAVRSGLIQNTDPTSIKDFISQQATTLPRFTPPKHLDFEALLDKKEELLKTGLSLRGMTQRVNMLLEEKQVALPKVTNSMLTRLKKEPVDTLYKQNVLRSLAFWIGHERRDIAADWNYETLLTICRKGRKAENYREGARIGFALYSRGDIIDHEILAWLRKTLKEYIDQSITHFSYGRWGKVRAHDITTLYVDFPKEKHTSDPTAFRQCLRSAVSLAHQMAIRWALSGFCTKKPVSVHCRCGG